MSANILEIINICINISDTKMFFAIDNAGGLTFLALRSQDQNHYQDDDDAGGGIT